ncbi:glycosyltransferase [Kaistella haifensis]|nr:glycosyltransferase [Kaistella haifensis]
MNKLAIVIPYYKLDFFEETLKSVAAQTDKRFTLYIGNDASPDDPFPLIEKYFPEGNYHYFDYKENLGGKNLAMQWERILENVKEEWFQILGDDDMISENFVEEFYQNLPVIKEENVHVVKIKQTIINEKGEALNTETQYAPLTNAVEMFILKLFENHQSSLSEHIFSLTSYKTKHFKKYPLAWYTDDMAVLEFSQNRKIFFISTSKVLVRIFNNSVSGNNNHVFKQKKLEAKYIFLGDILNEHYKQFSRDEVSKLIKVYMHLCWVEGKKLAIQLLPIYLYTKQYRKIVSIPRTKKILNENSDPLKRKAKMEREKKENWYLYQKLISSDLLIQQRKNPLSIPILIINYNQLYYLKQLVNFLMQRKFENIVIIDNGSDYLPLLEYYTQMKDKVNVEKMDHNFGHKVFFENKDLQKKYGQGYYVITDPDIVPNNLLPTDFITQMIHVLEKYFHETTKVGFALDIDSIPNYFPLKDKVIQWEKQFWENRLEHNIYKAQIDSTFAIYKPTYPKNFNRQTYLQGIRISGHFTCFHGGWYINPKNYTEENLFYLRKTNIASSWKLDEQGNHDNRGTVRYEQ